MNKRGRRELLKDIATGALGASLSGLLESCQTAPGKRKLELSSPETRRLLAEMAETLLPETETPGAKSAGVDRFLILAMKDCFSQKDQNRFLDGLREFENKCHAKFNRSFLDCSQDQRLNILEETDADAFGLLSKLKSKLLRREHFFSIFKQLAVAGYFTSRPGATQALAYESVPGRWIGCFEMQPEQKTWATQ
jgi:hypothetical protein